MMKTQEISDLTISVDDLEVGMHIVGIDRPWEETDFLLQSFVIHTEKEIQELRYYCNEVTIQVGIEHGQTKPQSTVSALTRPKLPAEHALKNKKVNYINKVSFEKAVENSRLTFKSARSMASNIMQGLRVGRSLDVNACRTQVKNVVDCVLENKDALKYLTMIKNKDDYTAEHSMNVCILAATFARHLGHQKSDIQAIALSALLHDVGKSKVPLEILNKPGRFDKEEAHIMAEHTTYGRNILMASADELKHAVDVAHSHHERVDGKGYPRCLVGNQIPYFAKVVAIVDAYDAMTSERCYGKPKTSYTALKIITENAGSQFDFQLADEFVKCIGLFSAGVLVEMVAGHIAIVIKPSETDYMRPMILIISDTEKKPLKKATFLDLNKAENSALNIKEEIPNGSHGYDVTRYISHKLF